MKQTDVYAQLRNDTYEDKSQSTSHKVNISLKKSINKSM